MGATTAVAVIEVFGDDVLHSEDVARGLGAELSELDRVEVRLEYRATGPVPMGAKGTEELLRLVVEYAWPVAAPFVAEAVKLLCARHRHERVRVTVGRDYVEITGDPTEEQARLLSETLQGLRP